MQPIMVAEKKSCYPEMDTGVIYPKVLAIKRPDIDSDSCHICPKVLSLSNV